MSAGCCVKQSNSCWVQERIAIYRQLVANMKQHFMDDERGRRKAFYFLPWHFSFFCRYR